SDHFDDQLKGERANQVIQTSRRRQDVRDLCPVGRQDGDFLESEATAGIEPAMKVLQTSALPLGYVADERGSKASLLADDRTRRRRQRSDARPRAARRTSPAMT